jgi:hypothetical protein
MMLAQTLFTMALLTLFAASAVTGVAGVARAQSANAAKALIVPGIETAVGRYQRDIAATIAAQLAPSSGAAQAPPDRIPALNGAFAWSEKAYREAAGGDSPLQVAIDIRPTAQMVPACANASAGPDIARALQCSPFVQESRLSLTVTSDAGPADANGAVSALAHNRTIVTLRLFAQPPYSAVAGIKDAADPDGFHEGDGAGYGNALGTFAAPAADDTTIHVVYECVNGTGSCATSNPPPADAPTNVPWTNGNGAP